MKRNGELTGMFCHKRNCFGSMVLWVQVETRHHEPEEFTATHWRKADEIDATELLVTLSSHLEETK